MKKPSGSKKDDKKAAAAELSPEDEQLKEDIAMCVERTVGDDAALQQAALQRLVTEIRTSTASMTSVPKPLKFLRPHVARLQEYFRDRMPPGDNKVCPPKTKQKTSTAHNTAQHAETKDIFHTRKTAHTQNRGSWQTSLRC